MIVTSPFSRYEKTRKTRTSQLHLAIEQVSRRARFAGRMRHSSKAFLKSIQVAYYIRRHFHSLSCSSKLFHRDLQWRTKVLHHRYSLTEETLKHLISARLLWKNYGTYFVIRNYLSWNILPVYLTIQKIFFKVGDGWRVEFFNYWKHRLNCDF